MIHKSSIELPPIVRIDIIYTLSCRCWKQSLCMLTWRFIDDLDDTTIFNANHFWRYGLEWSGGIVFLAHRQRAFFEYSALFPDIAMVSKHWENNVFEKVKRNVFEKVFFGNKKKKRWLLVWHVPKCPSNFTNAKCANPLPTVDENVKSRIGSPICTSTSVCPWAWNTR